MSTRPLLAILDGIGGPELLLVFVVVLIFFGGEKMPEFARGLGKILREFKKATSEVEHEIKRAMAEPEPPVRPYVPPTVTAAATAATTPPPPAEFTPGAPAALGQPADSAHPGESTGLAAPAPAFPAFEAPATGTHESTHLPTHGAPPAPPAPPSTPPGSPPPRDAHRPSSDDHGIDA